MHEWVNVAEEKAVAAGSTELSRKELEPSGCWLNNANMFDNRMQLLGISISQLLALSQARIRSAREPRRIHANLPSIKCSKRTVCSSTLLSRLFPEWCRLHFEDIVERPWGVDDISLPYYLVHLWNMLCYIAKFLFRGLKVLLKESLGSCILLAVVPQWGWLVN